MILVEMNILVGQIRDEIEKFGDDGVELVSCYFGFDMLDQCLIGGQDLFVYDICRFFGVVIVYEFVVCSLFEKFNLFEVKVKRVDLFENNVG